MEFRLCILTIRMTDKGQILDERLTPVGTATTEQMCNWLEKGDDRIWTQVRDAQSA